MFRRAVPLPPPPPTPSQPLSLALPPPPPPPLSLMDLLARLIEDVKHTTTTAVANNDDDDEKSARKRHRLTVIESLLRQEQLPLQQRTKVDVLVEQFQRHVSNDIHKMIVDQRDDNEGYQGLDIRRDTHAEVETALRIYPDVITRQKDTRWNSDDEEWIDVDDGDYPIQCLTIQYYENDCNSLNTKAIPFIHLFAKLATEFNSFSEEERGGLLFTDQDGDDVFNNLACGCRVSYHRRADDVISTEWIQLRQLGLMKKDDIMEYKLLFYTCHQYGHILENCVRFLVEWDPGCLLQIDSRRWSALQIAANRSVQSFRFLFEYVIRYFPYKKGISILFQNDEDRTSPFRSVCACNPNFNPSKRKEAKDAVDAVLSRYHSTTPINTVEALLLTATNPTIGLDGVYFLLRRQPEVLLKMVSHSETITNTTASKQDRKRKRSKFYHECIVLISIAIQHAYILYLFVIICFCFFFLKYTFLLFFFIINFTHIHTIGAMVLRSGL